jgi:hypothetical protein
MRGLSAGRRSDGLPTDTNPGYGDNQAMERVITHASRHSQQARDLQWWLSRPMAERLAAVEALRREALRSESTIDTEPEARDAEPRLQRVCRIVARQRR